MLRHADLQIQLALTQVVATGRASHLQSRQLRQ